MDTLYLSGRASCPHNTEKLTETVTLLRDYAFPVLASHERYPEQTMTVSMESPIRDDIHHTVMMVAVFFQPSLDPVTLYEVQTAQQAAIPMAGILGAELAGRPPAGLPEALQNAFVRWIDLPDETDLLINPLISVINRHRLV